MREKANAEAEAVAALKECSDREWRALVEESHIPRTSLEHYVQEFEHAQKEVFTKMFPRIAAALDTTTDSRN